MTRLRLTFIVALGVLAGSVCLSAQDGQQTLPSSLTLEEALQYALDHYPNIRAAVEQVNVSAANVSVAKSAYLPRLDALWQTNRGTANNIVGQLLPQPVIPGLSGPVLPSTTSQSAWGSAAGALLSWEPFDLGLRDATVREADASMVRARAEEAVTRLDVQSAVGSAFLAVVSAQQALAAAEADLQRRDVLVRAAHVLTDNQLRPGAEAARADAERAAALTRTIQARQALAIARATLGRVLGTSARAVSVNAARLLDRVPPAKPPAASTAEHPLVQSRLAAVDFARAQETVLAKTDRPKFLLQSSVFARGSGANPDGRFDGGANGLGLERANWAAGIQVLFPNAFDFANLRARRAASAASTRVENARYEAAVLEVASQREMADAVAEAARAIALNTPVQLAAAQQSEAQARARYEAGLASIVEVAEAQSLLAQAEYQDAAAHVDVWRALLAQAVARDDMASFIELVRGSGAQ